MERKIDDGHTGPPMRLAIEPLTVDDAADLFAALSDPRVYAHIDAAPPRDAGALRASLARMVGGPPADRAGEAWWNFAVRLAGSGEAIGRLEATIVDDRAEIAYLFGPDHWGYGYAAEAVGWLHGRIAERTGATTVWATTRPGNARSARLLGRLGYVRADSWPALTSYDPGDVVYSRPIPTA